MSQPQLKNTRSNKIVAYLTDAKMRLDAEFARLGTDFELLSNYPPTPTPETLTEWHRNIASACKELSARIDEFRSHTLKIEQQHSWPPTAAFWHSSTIESNWPPREVEPPTGGGGD